MKIGDTVYYKVSNVRAKIVGRSNVFNCWEVEWDSEEGKSFLISDAFLLTKEEYFKLELDKTLRDSK